MQATYLKELITGALLTGHHTLISITSDINQYSPFQILTALNEMKKNGYVDYHNNNIADQYGYYINEQGINKYIR